MLCIFGVVKIYGNHSFTSTNVN